MSLLARTARLWAQLRTFLICSSMVVARGTEEPKMTKRSSSLSLRPSAKASYMPEMMTCSISEPDQFLVICASCGTLKSPKSLPRLLRWMRKISSRSLRVGRSMKKIWSKRPRRRSSAGSRSMRLAVAAMKISEVCSCIQVRK